MSIQSCKRDISIKRVKISEQDDQDDEKDTGLFDSMEVPIKMQKENRETGWRSLYKSGNENNLNNIRLANMSYTNLIFDNRK